MDIFAGPGGLGEGFSRYPVLFGSSSVRFKAVLSIEKDPVAAGTLTLRSWIHQFRPEDIPGIYYNAVPPFPAAQLAFVVADILEKSG